MDLNCIRVGNSWIPSYTSCTHCPSSSRLRSSDTSVDVELNSSSRRREMSTDVVLSNSGTSWYYSSTQGVSGRTLRWATPKVEALYLTSSVSVSNNYYCIHDQ